MGPDDSQPHEIHEELEEQIDQARAEVQPDLQCQSPPQPNAFEIARLRLRVDRLEQDLATLQHLLPAAPPLHAPPPPPPPFMFAGHAAPAAPPPAPIPPSLLHSAPPPPSLENRLGSQVFNRVGIIAIFFAAAWFLKLAIDNQWIGPVGRVLAGLIAGTAIVLWSERFRRHAYSAFSFSLKAIGSGILYLSLWAAFQLYHLLPAGAALGAMILVTVWNAWMAWVQDSEMLAAYALAGGLLTPILLSTGGDHQIFLFTYLLAIDLATVALVRLKPWPKLPLAVLPATIAYFIGWYGRFFYLSGTPAHPIAITAGFVVLFFVTFASVPIRRATSASVSGLPPREHDTTISEILLPLSNAAFASLALYSILQDSGHHDALPWMTLAFAAAFLALMRLPQSRLASAIHLSLAIVFLTITIPIKATGRWITIGWLMEAVALFYVSARLLPEASATAPATPAIAHRVLRLLASVSLALGVAGLLFLPLWLDANVGQALLNRRFATALAGLAALALVTWTALHPRSTASDPDHPAQLDDPYPLDRAFPRWLQVAAGAIIAFNLVALHTGVREIDTFWNQNRYNSPNGLQTALSVSAFLMLYGAGLLAVGFWQRSAFVRWQALILIVITIAKTFLYDMRNLSGGYRALSFLGLGVLLMAVSFTYQKDWLALKSPDAPVPDSERAA